MRPRLLVPGLTTLAMLAVLIGLGVWQLQRRDWKLGILAQIDQAEAAPAIPLPAQPLPFTKVRVSGRLLDDKTGHYGAEVRDLPSGPAMGSQLIEALERSGQDPVLIDRGWVPDGAVLPPGGDASIEGYIRSPDAPGLFTPNDDLATRHFYTLDPARIGAALGLARVAPFTLVAMGPGTGVPAAATALPRPPNDHLNYALTWFGLALSLLAVFAAYSRKVFRR